MVGLMSRRGLVRWGQTGRGMVGPGLVEMVERVS